MTALPTRQQIEAAEPLTFPDRAGEKQANIQIQIGPAGVTILVEYTGAVSSIQAALERLRKAGVMDAVQASKPAEPAPAAAQRAKVERVEPWYNDKGETCCPVHRKPLSLGTYGLYCSAKARPGEATNPKGYCSLRFAE